MTFLFIFLLSFLIFRFFACGSAAGGEGREGVFLHARGLCQKPAKVLFAEKQSGGFLVQVWPISHKVPFCAVVQKAANIHREHRQASHQMDRKNRRRIIINLQIYSLERARLCRVFLHQSRDFTKKKKYRRCLHRYSNVYSSSVAPATTRFPTYAPNKKPVFPRGQKKKVQYAPICGITFSLSPKFGEKKSRFLLRNRAAEKVQTVFISAKVCGRSRVGKSGNISSIMLPFHV